MRADGLRATKRLGKPVCIVDKPRTGTCFVHTICRKTWRHADVARRHVEVQLDENARRTACRLLQERLQRRQLDHLPRARRLGGKRLRHTHIQQFGLHVQDRPAVRDEGAEAQIHGIHRAQPHRLLPPHVHGARRMERQGSLHPLRFRCQCVLRLRQRPQGGLLRRQHGACRVPPYALP